MITLKEHNVKPYGELCAMLATEQKCAYVAATGTGKSYVVGKYIEDRDTASDTLILVPSREIKHNWEKLIPGVSVITYQALCQNKTRAEGRKLIVCDEMHHLGAKKWGSVYAEAIKEFKGKLIGITATPIRFLDNSRNMAEECFDSNVVEGMDLPAAISAGVLPTFEYVTALYNLPSRIPDESNRNKYTEYLFRQLDIMKSEYSFQSILKKHLDGGKHKVVVFVNQIGNVDGVRDSIREIYPCANHYISHSKMNKAEAKKELDMFAADENMSFIYTVDMLNEGVHIKGVDCVIMFRRTESPNIYLQQLGRALASDMADTRVKIFDFAANHNNLKSVQEGSGTVISWIVENISDHARQIIVRDYVLDELKVLKKISEALNGQWTPEEDVLLIEKYNHGKGVDELLSLLEGRTKGSIMQRARHLNLVNRRRDYKAEGVYDAVKELYPLENGIDLLKEKFPDCSRELFVGIATRLGLRDVDREKRWTPEEDAILVQMNNERASIKDIAEKVGRKEASVTSRKVVLGIRMIERHKWTEEEDQILLKTAQMSGPEIQKLYFPELKCDAINSRRKKLGINVNSNRVWPKEKTELFTQLYLEGGVALVRENEMFSNMTGSQISGRAGGLGIVRGKNTGSPWTEEELNILMDYILIPQEKRPPISELAKSIPNHTPRAIYKRKLKMEKAICTQQDG